jgi:hypothetical protein
MVVCWQFLRRDLYEELAAELPLVALLPRAADLVVLLPQLTVVLVVAVLLVLLVAELPLLSLLPLFRVAEVLDL